MKKYILFDLDGTLTDPMLGITRTVQYALEKFGIHEEIENLIPFIGPPLKDSFEKYYDMTEEQALEAISYYHERFRKIGMFENKVIPGIPEVLDALCKSGKTLIVATSKPTEFSVMICDRFELSQYFVEIVGSEMDGTRSQKHEVIEEIIRKYNINPDEAIMVGDRKFDISGAKQFGIQSVGVEFGYAAEGELEEAGADYIVKTPEELLFLCEK